MIQKWLRTFYRRFFCPAVQAQLHARRAKGQFGIFLAPGRLAMPSDAVAKLWLDEVELLQDAGTDLAKYK